MFPALWTCLSPFLQFGGGLCSVFSFVSKVRIPCCAIRTYMLYDTTAVLVTRIYFECMILRTPYIILAAVVLPELFIRNTAVYKYIDSHDDIRSSTRICCFLYLGHRRRCHPQRRSVLLHTYNTKACCCTSSLYYTPVWP